METIYQDIAARTGGNIYIGVVGPVRTGKSTLIKRIMEQLVLPCMEDPYLRERAKDELPQCGSGKTIMTSEPKFVPEEAVEIMPDQQTTLSVRMIDSVGYMVTGAVGAEEDGSPRMVTTPWYDREIPMTEAAELGTKKVMEDHCSVGIVVTTDGTITDIPRSDYITAEQRAIQDMQATGKPFLVIINTRNPASEEAQKLKEEIADAYQIHPMVADCQNLTADGIQAMLSALLFTFPMSYLQVWLPRWVDALPTEHPIRSRLCQALLEASGQIFCLGDAAGALASMESLEEVSSFRLEKIDSGTGIISCRIELPDSLFYKILSEQTGVEIRNDGQLMQILAEFAKVKKEYDKIADAMESVKATGYGVVMPGADEMHLSAPELLKKGNAYGVRLKADAPSIHMIRVDVDTEISPIVGDEQQSRDLIDYLSGEEPEKLWESNIFGKSVYALIQDGLTAKLVQTPQAVRDKFRGALGKIVNEGAAGLICIIL